MRNKWVIWPVYLDANESKKKGRKLPQSYALKDPKTEEIYRAAKTLGLNPVKEEKAYPKRWWRKDGRVLVDKKDRKLTVLTQIAAGIKQNRLTNNKSR